MKSGRVTGRKQATNSLKVNTHCFVTQITYKRNKNINLKHNKPKMLRFSRTFFLYDEILGLKRGKKDKEKAVRWCIERRQKLTYGHYLRLAKKAIIRRCVAIKHDYVFLLKKSESNQNLFYLCKKAQDYEETLFNNINLQRLHPVCRITNVS